MITDHDPDYMILGETLSYNLENITRAIRLVAQGAHFIATNPDSSGPTEAGIVPACGAMAALIEKACGVSPFFIGKPNPLMMRTALNYLGVHSENTGDDRRPHGHRHHRRRGKAGSRTCLVLTGLTRREEIARFPFQPTPHHRIRGRNRSLK